jgi:hypothetical protein
MITDPLPRATTRRADYKRSDELRQVTLPPANVLQPLTDAIDGAIGTGRPLDVQQACQAFAAGVVQPLALPPPGISILGTRPHRTQEGVCIYEKFGDYDLTSARIRIWMRTAMRHQVTSFGALLHTLCHELCHHIDVVGLGLADTPHTRGFYERTALLYHHARQTPRKPLAWVALRDGRYRLDWGRTMRTQGVTPAGR